MGYAVRTSPNSDQVEENGCAPSHGFKCLQLHLTEQPPTALEPVELYRFKNHYITLVAIVNAEDELELTATLGTPYDRELTLYGVREEWDSAAHILEDFEGVQYPVLFTPMLKQLRRDDAIERLTSAQMASTGRICIEIDPDGNVVLPRA